VTTVSKDDQATALIEKLVEAGGGFFTVHAAYLGIKLGYYRALARSGTMTPPELAKATGTDERYTREWMEQQAVTGMLALAANDPDPAKRRYSLPEGHAEVLTEDDSLNYLAPMVQLMIGAASPLEDLLRAYRTGEGVPFGDYGVDVLEGQGAVNRAALLQQLGGEWLPAVPDLHAKLQEGGKLADFGCGVGWSAIGLAETYPKVTVDGFDLDPPSIALAKENAKAHGVDDRVRFEVRDAGDEALSGQYDLVLAIECIHDMADPVSALRVMRKLCAPGGSVFIVDENVADEFNPPGGELEWMMYGWSILHCLPAGLADQPSAGTGTVLRAPMMQRYAEEAGFTGFERLPIEADFFQFYRLTP
jgi:SAM-dependent methyltransferase